MYYQTKYSNYYVNHPYPIIPAHYQTYYTMNNRPYPVAHWLQFQSYRPYPQIDETNFHNSAVAFQKLMKEADLFVNKVAESPEFAKKLMEAAQSSNQAEVDKLIKSTGITTATVNSFNPDGIRLEFSADVEGSECCKLTIALKWS